MMNIRLIKDALEAGLENTQELACDHEITLGRTTSKNNATAIRYEQEIEKMQKAIEELNQYEQ